MNQTPETRRNLERERERERERNNPCGLISRICIPAIMLVVGTIVPFEAFCADLNNPEIQRLIAEKQQKIATLEKCGKKVKGFKIAGISTIGLTAVGVAGNVALSNKREEVSNQLTTAKQTLAKQQAAAKKAECDKDSNKEWKDGECKDKPKPEPGDNVATDDNQGKANTDAGNITTTETITEGRIVGKECIGGDLSYKASAGKYIKLARAFTIEKDKWSSLRCWFDDKKTSTTYCSCAATACADEEYEIKQGLCIKKTEKKAETAETEEKTSETTTTTTTIKLDASKEGVGYLYKDIDDGEEGNDDGTYNKCSVSSNGDWCVQFDDYIVSGTSTCTADSGTCGQTTNKNYDSAKSDGKYCYCKMTSWTPQNGGSKTDTSASSWVFRNDISGAADCADLCASGCAGNVQLNSAFRGTVFGDYAK